MVILISTLQRIFSDTGLGRLYEKDNINYPYFNFYLLFFLRANS